MLLPHSWFQIREEAAPCVTRLASAEVDRDWHDQLCQQGRRTAVSRFVLRVATGEMLLLRQAVLCLLVARTIAAFLPPPHLPGTHLGQRAPRDARAAAQQSSSSGQKRASRAVSSPGLRVAMVDSSEALQQLQDWGGAPPNSKFLCSSSKSDAGVMAEFFSEVSSEAKGAQQMILAAPNCRSAADATAMQRLVDHLKRSCDGADVQRLDGAPHPALSFVPKPAPAPPASDLTSADVMNKCLDWFQAMLVTLTDEEDFIEIGRILLSVKQYTVNSAVSAESLQAGFWREVAALVEGGEGNTMMVAPNFMLDDPAGFEAFVHRQLERPLAEWASESKEVYESCIHINHVDIHTKNGPWLSGHPSRKRYTSMYAYI